MAIKDDRLKQFFSKQKVGAFDALAHKGKVTTSQHSSSEEKIVDKLVITAVQEEIQETKLPFSNTPINEIQPIQFIEETCVAEPILKPTINREQSVSNPLAIRDSLVSNPLAVSEQYVSNPLPIPLADSLAKFDDIQFTDLRLFSKKERELIVLVFEQCRNNGSLISPPISTEEIRSMLKITPERVRNLIFRIVRKGGMKIIQHKSGQSAYRVFELSKSLYQSMIDLLTNQSTRSHYDPLANSLANPLANVSYSSSNINTTTALPENWEQIDFTLLTDIGFSKTQLMQLYEKRLNTPEVVQESINHFAFGLANNPKFKIYSAPLNVLIGVLRKGQAWHEPGYVSPKELALRQMLEEKRKQKEQYDAMIKELIDLEFPEWKRQLTEDEIKSIVPLEVRKTNMTAAIQASLRTHFTETILLPRLNNAS